LGVGIVVIKELAKTTETLWLRGLGKDCILSEAFTDITELPVTRRERNDILEVCIKHFKYLNEKSSISGLTAEEEDFMKTMQDIDQEYRAEMERSRLQGQMAGRQELVIYLLANRVGSLADNELDWVRSLPIERLLSLGEALIDFKSREDWAAWQHSNS
jgi:hypothetical protein